MSDSMLEMIRAQIHDAEYAAVAAKARYEALLEVEEMLRKQQELPRRRQPRGMRVAGGTATPETALPWDDEEAPAA